MPNGTSINGQRHTRAAGRDKMAGRPWIRLFSASLNGYSSALEQLLTWAEVGEGQRLWLVGILRPSCVAATEAGSREAIATGSEGNDVPRLFAAFRASAGQLFEV